MNTKKLDMMMSILKFGLVAIGVIACIFLFGGPNMEATLEEQETFREGGAMAFANTFTGFILFAGIGIVLIFFVVQLITNPKKTLMSIIGILGAAVLYLILSMMGSGDTNESLQLLDDVKVEQATINSTSAGIFTVLIGLVIALVVVVLGPFMGRFRK